MPETLNAFFSVPATDRPLKVWGYFQLKKAATWGGKASTTPKSFSDKTPCFYITPCVCVQRPISVLTIPTFGIFTHYATSNNSGVISNQRAPPTSVRSPLYIRLGLYGPEVIWGRR